MWTSERTQSATQNWVINIRCHLELADEIPQVGYLAKDLSVTKEGSKENSNGTATGAKVDEVDDNSQDDFKVVLTNRQRKHHALH